MSANRPPIAPTQNTKRTTMRDVAIRAGVGTITVSRALKEPDKVSPELRTRIEAAIKELGYVPNRMAGGLSSLRARVVPVVVPAIRNAVFSDLVEGVSTVLNNAGYQIFLGATDYDQDREESLIAEFLGWIPEGIILVGTNHTEAVTRMLQATEATVVELFELGRDPIDVNIGFSNTEAAGAMTDYLVDKGYRNIVFVGAYMEQDRRAAQRLSGFQKRMTSRGMDAQRVLTYPQRSSYELGGDALHQVRERWPEADAVFFANDVLAVGAVLEAGKTGIKVPQDIAVAGFNGLEIGARTSPDITTVDSPRFDMGKIAAEVILQRRTSPETAIRQIDIPYSILSRGSA